MAVAMSYDPPSCVVNYTVIVTPSKWRLTTPVWWLAKAWGDVQLTPTTYLVSKRGEIVKQYVGEARLCSAAHTLIEKLLAET